MNIIRSDRPLEWGALDLPLFGITSDWAAKPLEAPAAWSLAVDGRYLWFVAAHSHPARVHPASRPGRFQPELWKYDVAELFLGHPSSGSYLELNLSPNGAWWSCEFTAPRQRRDEVDIAMPEVATFAELAPNGGWVAAMALPLDLLRARLDFGEATTANVAFILHSPEQRFLSATPLGNGDPDFHRPEHFKPLSFVDGDLPGSPRPA